MEPRRRGRKTTELDPRELPNQAWALRNRRGITYREIARVIAVWPNAIRRFETTGRGLKEIKEYALAKALGVPIQELLTPGEAYAQKVHASIDNVNGSVDTGTA